MQFWIDHLAALLAGTALILILFSVQQDLIERNVASYEHYTLRTHAKTLVETLKGDLSNLTEVTDFQQSNGLLTRFRFEANIDSTSPDLEEISYTLSETDTPCTQRDAQGNTQEVTCYTLARSVNGGAPTTMTTTLDSLVVVPRDASNHPVSGATLAETQIIQVELVLYPPHGSSDSFVQRSRWRAFFRPEMLQLQ